MTKLKIAHHNIRSINNKIYDLRIYLQNNKPDILTINESGKINPQTKFQNYNISTPSNNKGQGLAILYKQNITIRELPPIDTTNPTTNLQHSILLITPKKDIQITTIYCPAKKPSEEIITGIITRHEHTIITGDFNSRHTDFGHDKDDYSGTTLVNITSNYNYTKLNDNEPTYTNDRTGKQDVKDLIFSSPSLTKEFIEFWVDEDLGSDHNIITATFSDTGITTNTTQREIKLYHKADWNHINEQITTTMTTTTLNHKSTINEIDNYITKLTTNITKTINDNVKTKTITENRIGLPKHIRNMIKDKKYIRKKWKQTGIKYYKTLYNTHNNEIKKLIKLENQKRWARKCNDLELQDHQNTTWPQLKQILGTKRPPPKYPTLITKNNDNEIIRHETPEKKIKLLTNTLVNIFTEEQDKPHFDNNHKNDIDNQYNNNKHIYKPLKTAPINYKTATNHISKLTIIKSINKLKNSKAPGPDKITNKIIKLTSDSLVNILHNLYNLCWSKGYHPNLWKIPLSILINKPDKPTNDPNNYRPIALINCLGKILEHIIKTKLTEYIENNNLINTEQAGFRTKKSTHDKIFQLTQIAIQSKNRKKSKCASVFMDVEKAFDKVWHHGLIQILHSKNIPIQYIKFIHSFLHNRYTYFKINDLQSPLIKINSGVPQGSALSPILFLLYVSNIPKPDKTIFTSQFADDIKTFSTANQIQILQKKLQKSMDHIAAFCGKSRITLNEKKTKELFFTGRVHPQSMPCYKDLTLHNKPIEATRQAKFLGVIFDSNLSFTPHINIIASRAKARSTNLYKISNLKHGPSPTTMVRLFNIFVRPLFEYGHTATITTSKSCINKWEIIQTKFIRHILQLPNISNNTTLKYAYQPTIRTRINHLALQWYNNIYINNNTPIIHFIANHTKDYNSFDKYKTPLKIIKQLKEQETQIRL